MTVNFIKLVVRLKDLYQLIQIWRTFLDSTGIGDGYEDMNTSISSRMSSSMSRNSTSKSIRSILTTSMSNRWTETFTSSKTCIYENSGSQELMTTKKSSSGRRWTSQQTFQRRILRQPILWQLETITSIIVSECMWLYLLMSTQDTINLTMSKTSNSMNWKILEIDLEWYFVMFLELHRQDEIWFETLSMRFHQSSWNHTKNCKFDLHQNSLRKQRRRLNRIICLKSLILRIFILLHQCPKRKLSKLRRKLTEQLRQRNFQSLNEDPKIDFWRRMKIIVYPLNLKNV